MAYTEQIDEAVLPHPLVTRDRRRLLLAVSVGVLSVLAGITIGWGAFRATGDLTPSEVASLRAEEMVDHQERLWQAELERVHRTRAEEMVDHQARVWHESNPSP